MKIEEKQCSVFVSETSFEKKKRLTNRNWMIENVVCSVQGLSGLFFVRSKSELILKKAIILGMRSQCKTNLRTCPAYACVFD